MEILIETEPLINSDYHEEFETNQKLIKIEQYHKKSIEGLNNFSDLKIDLNHMFSMIS